MGVDSLGYVGFNVTKMAEWRTLLEQVFGMEARPRAAGGAVDFRLDEYHHRITLHPAAEDSVAVVGWEVGSPEKLDQLADLLREKGADVAPGTAEQCDASKVKKLYRYTCPMIGCPTEIYYGPLVSHTSFTPVAGSAATRRGRWAWGISPSG